MALLDRPHEVNRGLGALVHANLNHASGADSASGCVFYDDRVFEHVVKMANPSFVEPLFVFGRVKVGVFTDVAVLARPLDPLRYFAPTLVAAPCELLA